MDPASLTAATIATLILTKASEKTGEKLGEAVSALGGKLLSLLQRKSPTTAAAIAKVAQQPELAEQQPADYGTAVLVQQVEQAAAADAEVQQAVQEVADAVRSQTSTVQNLAKLADKIGINIQGGNTTFSGNIFNT
jgi:hypothetical protein